MRWSGDRLSVGTIEPAAGGFDLNLLRIVLALGRTRHLTRAAELLGMSQSGFSSALARLRRRTGDQLFLRGAGGMLPTPRAERMIEAAAAVLATVEDRVLAPPEFDPATSCTELRLATPDVGEIVFLPRLLEKLQRVAPRISLRSEALPEAGLPEALAAGEADMAVGYYPDLSAQVFLRRRLYLHTFACIVRRGHPLDRKKLTEAAFRRLGHVVVTAPSRSALLLESLLERRGIERRIVLRTPHHLSLPSIIEETDLIATVPLAVGMRFAQLGAVQLMPLPFPPALFEVAQHWHRRFQDDPRHRWLREMMTDLFDEASDRWLKMEEALYGAGLRSSR